MLQRKQINMIRVPDEWVVKGGHGSTVCVIDSHIDENSDVFKENVIEYVRSSNNGIYKNEHCTSICEIISFVAPLCKIIISQAIVGKNGTIQGLCSSVKNVFNKDFDVVNLSVSTSSDNVELRRLIDKLSEKAIVVSSMANDGSVSYPAIYDNVVSVSSFKKNDIDADIYCEDSFICKNRTKKTGNSMATAFVSGIFALAKSYDKNLSKDDIIKILLEKHS